MSHFGRTPVARTGLVALAVAAALVPSRMVSAQAPPCVPPPAGLVAWWTGDQTTADHAGTNHGTWGGSSGPYGSGLVDSSFRTGGTAWVQVPDSASLDITGAISINAWIYASEFGGRVVDRITAGGGDGSMLDRYNASTGPAEPVSGQERCRQGPGVDCAFS